MTDQHQTEAQRLAALLRSRNNNQAGFGLGPVCDKAADELLRLNSAHAALERVSMQLVACGVVARADTPDSAREARAMHPEYESLSCDDVKRRVDECIALRARVAELEDVLTNLPLSSPQRLRARIQRLEEMLAAVGAGGVGPLMPVTVQHQREPSSDNDLPIENGQLITSCSTVPAGWKPVPLELTQAMLDQLRFGWSDISTAHVFDRWKRTVAAGPQPPVVEQPQIDFHDMYLKERRRAEMWIAKYEQDIGKLERAVPAAAQPQVEQEPLCWVTGYYGGKCTVAPRNLATVLPVGTALYTRPQPPRQPLTQAQVIEGFSSTPHQVQYVSAFDAGVRYAERAHGIGGEA